MQDKELFDRFRPEFQNRLYPPGQPGDGFIAAVRFISKRRESSVDGGGDDKEIRVSTDLTRPHLVMLYVYGQLHELQQDGLIEGELRLTPKGLEKYQSLKRSGFRPTKDEIGAVCSFLHTPRA